MVVVFGFVSHTLFFIHYQLLAIHGYTCFPSSSYTMMACVGQDFAARSSVSSSTVWSSRSFRSVVSEVGGWALRRNTALFSGSSSNVDGATAMHDAAPMQRLRSTMIFQIRSGLP